MRKLNIIELYAGTGRSSEPFRKWKRANLPLLVDNNPYAAQVYKQNFPNAPYAVANLSTLAPEKLSKMVGGKVDILLGCPPCQGYSDTGTRRGDDPRNSHMTRFAAYIQCLQPTVAALENVPLSVESRRFKNLTDLIEKIGYRWTAAILNAAQYGSCQSRQRLILIAVRGRLGIPDIPNPTHGSTGKYFSYRFQKLISPSQDVRGILGVTPGTGRVQNDLPLVFVNNLGPRAIPRIDDVIGDLPNVGSSRAKSLDHFTWAHKTETLKRMAKVPEGGRWLGGLDHFSQTYGRLHRKGLARTITSFFPNAGSGRFWHPTENRSLTLREAARIQGFPDSFRFGPSQSENCLLVGNALDSAFSDVTYRIIREILE